MNPVAIEPTAPRIEWTMIIGLVGLMCVGTLFIASATMVSEADLALPFFRQTWFKQIVYYAVGSAAGTAVCLVPYQLFIRFARAFYAIMIAGLAGVLVIGVSRFGARRWIDLGPVQFQPSEFAKVAFILLMADYLSRPSGELSQMRVFLVGLAAMGVPFALILVEPDLGSALVFLPTGLIMMLVAGVPLRYIWRLVGGGAILAGLFLVDVLVAPDGWQVKLQPYQRCRLLVYFGKDCTPPERTIRERHPELGNDPARLAKAREQEVREHRYHSYNVDQALISVGSGGLTGKGWRQGTQNALGYLPRAVAHNDFIFSVIAEESGFLGSVVVLILYGMVLFSGIKIAGQADQMGKLVAVGVVTLLFSHVFINIGMNIRLMPVTGIPLPLLSYGGTSVVCALVAAGLMQGVYLHRQT